MPLIIVLTIFMQAIILLLILFHLRHLSSSVRDLTQIIRDPHSLPPQWASLNPTSSQATDDSHTYFEALRASTKLGYEANLAADKVKLTAEQTAAVLAANNTPGTIITSGAGVDADADADADISRGKPGDLSKSEMPYPTAEEAVLDMENHTNRPAVKPYQEAAMDKLRAEKKLASELGNNFDKDNEPIFKQSEIWPDEKDNDD